MGKARIYHILKAVSRVFLYFFMVYWTLTANRKDWDFKAVFSLKTASGYIESYPRRVIGIEPTYVACSMSAQLMEQGF